jgi:hypothetical protein
MALTTLNTAPIFSGTPRVSSAQITTTSTNVHTSGGSAVVGTNIFLAFTPGASGSYLQKIRFQYTSTTGVISAAATVFKIYLSSVNTGTPTTAQLSLIVDIQSPAQTISAVTTSAYPIEVPLNFAIPTGYFIMVGQTVAATTNGTWVATVFGGDY